MRESWRGTLEALLLASLSVLPAAAAVAAEGDAGRGERAFSRCYACHSVDPNETASLQGPNLTGVVGRRAAALPNFDYSDAMREKGAAGLTWDTATLDRYLADPEGVVPGTRMVIPPIRNAQERADLIAYLAHAGH